tara:strand:- start:396 stop:2282 length:1887 start_codon:yes stop_codon:yes gene_type:complete
MATYVNDLRLKEIGTGESSGTWGTETNVNLELIGEALSFGTEAITTNADTHTSTVADGSTDPARSMYIKYTGTLDSACTITIAPNTLSRLHFIENGTSGSQNIIISQGSGANVTIPPGDVKVVYLDGAGSGAAVVDAFASLSVVDLKVQDDLTVTDDLIVNGDIDLEGSIDVNGTANLDVVDVDGLLTASAAIEINGAAGSAISEGLLIDWSTNLARFLTYDSSSGSEIAFFTQPSGGSTTERVRIKEDGGFVVTPAAGGHAVFNEGSIDADFRVESNGNANMLFVDGGNDAVIVGHSASIASAGEAHELQVFDTNFSTISAATFRDGSDGATITLGHSRSGTVGTQTILNDDDMFGGINFVGSDGTDFANVGAFIRAQVDGTPGSNDMPGRIIFGTTPDGSTSPSERLRILSTGAMTTGGLTSTTGHLHLFQDASFSGNLILQSQVSANARASILLMSRTADNSNVNATLTNVTTALQSSLGISFGSDTAAANALDDYEEGSWTPALNNAGSPSYSVQYGRYTKVGRIVYCSVAVRATGVSGTSNIELTGLPFTPADVSDSLQRSTYAPRNGGHCSGLSQATGRFRILTNTSMAGVKGDTATSFMQAGEFSSGGSPQFTGDFWYYST